MGLMVDKEDFDKLMKAWLNGKINRLEYSGPHGVGNCEYWVVSYGR